MKICIIASRLFTGGFTTSMVNMIHALEKQNVNVDVLFLEPDKHEYNVEDYIQNHIIPFRLQKLDRKDILRRLQIKKIDANITKLKEKINKEKDNKAIEKLNVENVQYSILRAVLAYMPKIDLTAYDSVISWEELTCNYFLAYNVKAKKKIGYVHPDYVLSKFSKEVDEPVFKKLDKIVSVSNGTLETIKKVFPEMEEKMIYIPNVNNVEKIRAKANENIETFEKSSFDIVTVCRLSIYHKGLDRLLRIAKRLEEDKIEYNWYIVGEGAGRKEMEEYITANDIQNVHLVGNRENPYPYMKKADLFALQSNYEGRPVVVDEAIIIGTPVLVTNFESAKEQVKEEYGYVIEMDEEKIYNKIKDIITDPEQLEEKKKYLKEMDMRRYENVDKMLEMIKEG